MVETMLYLNDHLFKDNAQILALVRNKDRAIQRFDRYGGRSDLQFIVQDVCMPVDLDGDVDYIIHAASQASPKVYGSDPVGTLCPNTLGTYYLLELARKKNSEGFLFFSSGEVYGEMPPDKVPTREDWYGYVDPTDVRSCYAESKRMGENICVSWHHQYGIPAKIIRPFHTYGPKMRLDDGRVFADFVSDIVHRRDIVMKSDGSARRAFCYLADAARGFFTVMLKGNAGKAYNIGNDKCEVSVLELASELVTLFPEYGLRVVRQDSPASPGYMKSGISRNCPDISRARAIGWNPEYSINDGFRRTIMSFLDNKE
jgi:nucleoside-diphosphate-sugar epimerase